MRADGTKNLYLIKRKSIDEKNKVLRFDYNWSLK